MLSKRSLPNRAFMYESQSEHAKALALWKKRKTQKLYPGAVVRGAEIARVLGHKDDLYRLLKLIQPNMVLSEFGEIYGENLLLKLIEQDIAIDFEYPSTPKIDAARWSKGFNFENFPEAKYAEVKIQDLPSSGHSTFQVIYPKSSKRIFNSSRVLRKQERIRHEVTAIELKNVTAIIGSSGFLCEKILFVDEFRSSYPQIASPDDDPLILSITKDKALVRLIEPKTFEAGGFWLGIKYGHEFGHFVSTLLTRVKYFENHPEWGKWPLIISSSLTLKQREYLEILFPGIPLSIHSNSEAIRFKILVVAPTAVFSPATIHTYSSNPEWVFIDINEFQWLYAKMKESRTSTKANTKVAITRRGYDRRKCLNQARWEKHVKKQGFSLVDPADLSADAQINLFLNAKDVIGEVGSWIYLAGLNTSSNLVLLNNDSDFQVWNEISQLNTLRNSPIHIVKGKRKGSRSSLRNTSNVHASWHLTNLNFLKIRFLISKKKLNFKFPGK